MSTQNALGSQDLALVRLGQELKALGYRFITGTPATHARVNGRSGNAVARSIEDVFGWSRVFRPDVLPDSLMQLLDRAGRVEAEGELLRSTVRFSTLGDLLFVHSAFPTSGADAVFFGPDTYRFARAIRAAMPEAPRRIVDIGSGSGAGGLYARSLAKTDVELVLGDINAEALRFSRINAALNGVAGVQVVESDVFAAIGGEADLIVSNPPYLVDAKGRTYRHGGGALGYDLSLRILEESLAHLAPGGTLVLYTGTAIVGGVDHFHAAALPVLAASHAVFTYDEIDPDVFGEELDEPAYRGADRIAVVALTAQRSANHAA